MEHYLSENYLLKTDLAKELYETYGKELPIIDYHCHLSADEIAKDKSYDNPTQIMLNGDHYKWRVMRAAGIGEEYITGVGSDKEKFFAFAKSLELAAGHPVYFWTHMELKTYFGYRGNLNSSTAEQVWEICCKKLQSGLTVRNIINNSKVEVICTTDDPADDLFAHKLCREDKDLKVKVLPTYRPDKCINIHKDGFCEYVKNLGLVEKINIVTLEDLKRVLEKRLDFFIDYGCRVADHGLDEIYFNPCTENEANAIFLKAMSGQKLTEVQMQQYITHMMQFFGEMYAEKNLVMQIHYGALRNVNQNMMKQLGPDTGFDCIGDTGCGTALAAFLDSLEQKNSLPKTIIYSLNPKDNALLDTITGSFYQEGIKSKVHHGAAWWFNDNRKSIEEHLQTYASLTPIGTFLGMLTDSRSFLSFSRHDFFRRIFCNWISDLMEREEFLGGKEIAGQIIKNVSYENAKRYFNF